MKRIVKIKSKGYCYKYDQHPIVIKKQDLVFLKKLKKELKAKSVSEVISLMINQYKFTSPWTEIIDNKPTVLNGIEIKGDHF